MDGANTAWILTSTALVLFMTLPGLALFYGGLVRSTNVLSVLMHCFAIACMASRNFPFVNRTDTKEMAANGVSEPGQRRRRSRWRATAVGLAEAARLGGGCRRRRRGEGAKKNASDASSRARARRPPCVVPRSETRSGRSGSRWVNPFCRDPPKRGAHRPRSTSSVLPRTAGCARRRRLRPVARLSFSRPNPRGGFARGSPRSPAPKGAGLGQGAAPPSCG